MTIQETVFDKYGVMMIPTIKGQRQPCIPYSQFWENPPDLFDYSEMWRRWQDSDATLMCQKGVYGVDVDAKNDTSGNLVERFLTDLFFAGIETYVEKTPSGGIHLFFRTSVVLKKEDIACAPNREGKFLPIIEIRGERSLCRCFPTAGFEVVKGKIDDLPEISPDKIAELLEICRSYNEKPEAPTPTYEVTRRERITVESPGDDYSTNCSVQEIVSLFEVAGWIVLRRQTVGRILLRRPGARSKNHDADILVQRRVFKSYSPSAAEFETGKAYSFFACYAILAHSGNFKNAAQKLRSEGWGISTTVQTSGSNPVQKSPEDDFGDFYEEEIDAEWEEIRCLEMTLDTEIITKFFIAFTDHPEFSNRFHSPKRYPLLAPGMMMVWGGGEKARKTAVACAFPAAALSGKEICGFTVDIPDDGQILWIDTEQADYWVKNIIRRICIMAGMQTIPEGRFKMYRFKKLSVDRKIAYLKRIVASMPNLRLIIIDGIKDFSVDYNDNKEADRVMSLFAGISDSGHKPAIIHLIHQTKIDKTPRGHLGGEAVKKGDCIVSLRLNTDESLTDLSFTLVRGEKPPAQTFAVVGDNIPYVLGWQKPDYNINMFVAQAPVVEDFVTVDAPTSNAMERAAALIRSMDDEDIPF